MENSIFYTAVGHFRRKTDGNGQSYPVILINQEEYLVDIQEMSVWTILSWRLFTYQQAEEEYNWFTGAWLTSPTRTFESCLKRLEVRGLVASGSGSTDFEALYDLLGGLSVVPLSESLPLRLATFLKLIFKGTPFSTARELFQRDKPSPLEARVMALSRQATLSTAELVKCAEVGAQDVSSGEKIMEALYNDDYTTSDNIQWEMLRSDYGGSEANIALALANLGVDSTFFSVVPNNSLGKSAVRMMRSNDVHCTPVILSTREETPTHRLGTYYLETGYGIRPSKVTYDRRHSAITEYDFSKVDLNALLEGFDWLHLSGITPALSASCARFILDCLVKAKEKGLTVSFDGNFRSKLWTWEEARDFCTQCLPYVDVLLGIEPYHLWKDEEDHGKGDWKEGVPLQPSYEQQDEVFQHFVERYPNLKCIARHVRYAHSGSENSLMAYMWYQGHTFESKLFTFNILDRVGGGDAFASGLIYSMMHDYKPMDMVNFAVASSVIKHTIHGDGNITDDVESIRNLMNMNYDIKR